MQEVAARTAPERQRGDNAGPGIPRVVAQQPQKKLTNSGAVIDDLLSDISQDRGLETAASAPELLGLSMLGGLRISPHQVRALLVDDSRRLARVFTENNTNNRDHLFRWLDDLAYFSGALSEMLLSAPQHVPIVLGALGHGLRSDVLPVLERVCQILATVCEGLATGRQTGAAATWLLQTSALRDLAAAMVVKPEIRVFGASLAISCCHMQLGPLLSQDLKQVSRTEQDYLTTVHAFIRAFVDRPDAVKACAEQGVFGQALDRAVQRIGDERHTMATQQAASLLAVDLWLFTMGHAGAATARPLLDGLLAALKRATQREENPTVQIIAFSCLSRLLSELCEQCDPESTPVVYRAYVYALVEAETSRVRDFAMRNLIALLKKHQGVPVGTLVEPMLKKIMELSHDTLSVIDIELFLVIAKHQRCTARHAGVIFKLLGQVSIESADFGRAATLPLLAILHRFGDAEPVAAFHVSYLRAALSRLIHKTTLPQQCEQILEVLAKVACLKVPHCQDALRNLILEISKAYLMSFESLHPNLTTLLEMWPSDQAMLQQWAEEQFAPPEPPPQTDKASAEAGGGLVLRSISPSLHSDAPPTPAEGGRPAGAPEPSMGSGGDLPTHRSATAAVAVNAIDGAVDSAEGSAHSERVGQLAQEAEELRGQLNQMREQHQKAVEETEVLRGELDEARRLHEKVEAEVEELQQRRTEILDRKSIAVALAGKTAQAAPLGRRVLHARPGAGPRGRASGGAATAAAGGVAAGAPSEADLEQVAELMRAFEEPLQSVFGAYARPRRMKAGKREVLSVDGFEQVLADLGMASRLPKMAVAKTIRKARLQLEDDMLLAPDFQKALQHLAFQAFGPDEAEPMRDFGLEVPLEDCPVARRQVQALLQYSEAATMTSKAAGIRIARPVFARARRLFVLEYAKAITEALTAKLPGLKERDLPPGFELSLPAAVYAVPAGFPISTAERHCAELLDEILAKAVDVHFLEPVGGNAPSLKQRVIVRGHPDLSALVPERPEPREPKAAPGVPPPPARQQQPPPQQQREQQQQQHQQRGKHPAPADDGPAAPRQVDTVAAAGRSAERATRPGGSQNRRESPMRTVPASNAPKDASAAAQAPAPAPSPAVPRRRPGDSRAEDPSPAPPTQGRPRREPRQRSSSPRRQAPKVRQARQAPAGAAAVTVAGSGDERGGDQDGGDESNLVVSGDEAMDSPSPPEGVAKGGGRRRQHPRGRYRRLAEVGRAHPAHDLAPAPADGPAAAKQSPAPAASPPRPKATAAAARDGGANNPSAAAREPSNPPVAPKRQTRAVRQHSEAKEQTKSRQEAMKAALASRETQTLLHAVDPGLRRTFDFFALWKGGKEGAMKLPGFLTLGECFGLLDKETLKVIFSRYSKGNDLTAEAFPEALFACAVRTADRDLATGNADGLGAAWISAFQALSRHMMLSDVPLLRSSLDGFRRVGTALPVFSLAGEGSGAVAAGDDGSPKVGQQPSETPGGAGPTDSPPASPHAAGAIAAVSGGDPASSPHAMSAAEVLASAVVDGDAGKDTITLPSGDGAAGVGQDAALASTPVSSKSASGAPGVPVSPHASPSGQAPEQVSEDCAAVDAGLAVGCEAQGESEGGPPLTVGEALPDDAADVAPGSATDSAEEQDQDAF